MIELKETMHVVAEALKEGNDIMKNAITMSFLQFSGKLSLIFVLLIHD